MQQPLPVVGVITETELADGLAGVSALLQVLAGCFGFGQFEQCGVKLVAGPREGFEEGRLLVHGGRGAGSPRLRDRDVGPLGQQFEGFAKAELVVLHHEGEAVAACLADPAAERLAVG